MSASWSFYMTCHKSFQTCAIVFSTPENLTSRDFWSSRNIRKPLSQLKHVLRKCSGVSKKKTIYCIVDIFVKSVYCKVMTIENLIVTLLGKRSVLSRSSLGVNHLSMSRPLCWSSLLCSYWSFIVHILGDIAEIGWALQHWRCTLDT